MAAIRASTQGISSPPTGDPTAALIKAAHARSFNQFAKGARCLDLSLEGTTLTITPMNNGGSGRGFDWLSEKKICVNAEASPDEIGTALDQAFLECE